MMRRSRSSAVSGVLAVVLAVLAVCPCGPVMMSMSAADEGPHACCAKKPGISAREAGCCADHARPEDLAVTAAAPPSGSTTSLPDIARVASSGATSAIVAPHPIPPSAPPILRI